MEDKESFGFLMRPPLEYKCERINKRKALSLIGQAQHIMITKNLNDAQMGEMISNISQMLVFIQRDHYPKLISDVFKSGIAK